MWVLPMGYKITIEGHISSAIEKEEDKTKSEYLEARRNSLSALSIAIIVINILLLLFMALGFYLSRTRIQYYTISIIVYLMLLLICILNIATIGTTIDTVNKIKPVPEVGVVSYAVIYSVFFILLLGLLSNASFQLDKILGAKSSDIVGKGKKVLSGIDRARMFTRSSGNFNLYV